MTKGTRSVPFIRLSIGIDDWSENFHKMAGTPRRFTHFRKMVRSSVRGKNYNSSKGYAFQASTKAKAAYLKKVRARKAAVAAMVVPGFTRAVGNYARYAGAGAEKKFFDTALSFLFDTTGEVPATGQLTLIPQGDTESTRDGRKATIKSIQIRGILSFAPGATVGTGASYLYLILDTQCNGAAAAVTDVFTSNDMTTNMLNLNNSGRFRILKKWEWAWNVGAGVSAAYNNATKLLEFYKSCNIPVDWSSTTGAITEIRSNNLFLMAGANAQDDTVQFTGTCRLRFLG